MLDRLEDRLLLSADGSFPPAVDTNQDGLFQPYDALILLNAVSNDTSVDDAPQLDLNGDGQLSTADVDLIIGSLNSYYGGDWDAESIAALDDVTLAISDTVVSEGAAADVMVSLVQPTAEPVEVMVWSEGGTANAYEDFEATYVYLLFEPGGPTSQTVSVATMLDGVNEGDETFLMRASRTGGTTPAEAVATVTLQDVELDLPSLSVSDVTVSEGDSATVAVTLSSPPSEPLSLYIGSESITATEGSDYDYVFDFLTFDPAGPLTQTVAVPTFGDNEAESDETFRVVVTNSLTYESVRGTVTIQDVAPPATPCGTEHLALRLDYDDQWSSGSQVKGPNEPELGVGIFETEIPFVVEVGLHGCTAPAEYLLVVSVMAGDIPIPLSTQSLSVAAGSYFDESFTFVLPSGDSDQVELIADLYFDPPPISVPPGTVAQQTDPQDPPPLLKLHQRIMETTDRWRVELVDALPESGRDKGIEYVGTVGPHDVADNVVDFLMTDEFKASVIDAIESEGNVSPETALERFEGRLAQAKADIAASFRPVFEEFAAQLFSTDRPDAEALAGANDPTDPPGIFGRALDDIRAKIQAYLDSLPNLDAFPGIKKLDFHIELASISEILNSDAGESLSDYLKAGDVSWLWYDLRDTDINTFAILKRVDVSCPIADYGTLTLSAENVTAMGVGGFRLGGALHFSRIVGGYQFDMTLSPSVLHTPIDPFNIFGEGHQEYSVGIGANISNR